MLVDYIALLPEIVLAAGVILMSLVWKLRAGNTSKTFFTFCRRLLVIVIGLTAVFYNQGAGSFWENNNYTTLFKIVIYLLGVCWVFLSLKRFQNRSLPAFVFCLIVLLSLLCFSAVLSARSLWLLSAALIAGQLLNYPLLRIDADEKSFPFFSRHMFFSLFFSLLLVVGVALFRYYVGSDGFAQTAEFLERGLPVPSLLQPAFVLIMVFFLFVLGAAPFHFWLAGIMSGTVLPVSGYLALIPPVAYFSCFINLIVEVFFPLYGWFMPVLIIFGVLSVFFGAIGANSEENLRRIFAYAGLYYLGVLLISAADMQSLSLRGSFIYLFVYILSLLGIYTVFSGCRSKGEYLDNLSEIRGLSTRRPFLAAMLLVFMISLIGTPPLLGFLGKLSVINGLVAGRQYVLMAITAFSVLILTCAYLKVITAIYFEPRNISFDRVDKGVYMCVVINLMLIVFTVLKPKYLMHDIEMMLAAILQTGG